ncbi:MAG: 6-phosphogluconolactonase [Actinomycetota bacterium]
MAAPPELVVEPNASQLAQNTAARLVATLVAAQSVRALAYLAVTGGGILEQTMAALRDLPARDSIDWRRVSLWWGDERFVATDSADRNDRAAFAALFGSVILAPANVHHMPSSDGPWGDDVEAAAEAYAAELAAAATPDSGEEDLPHFDALLLGIGPDGHVASLFPEHPGAYEQDASVIAVRNSPKPPPLRTSLTFRAVEAANEVWVIASGTSKAQAVALALGGAGRVQIPAAGAHGRHRTLWLVDRDAAGKLPRDYHPPHA